MEQRQAAGIFVAIAAGGMILGLLGNEIKDLQSWTYLTTPAFVGKSFVHLASVVAAYVAGQLIPTAQALKPSTKE